MPAWSSTRSYVVMKCHVFVFLCHALLSSISGIGIVGFVNGLVPPQPLLVRHVCLGWVLGYGMFGCCCHESIPLFMERGPRELEPCVRIHELSRGSHLATHDGRISRRRKA